MTIDPYLSQLHPSELMETKAARKEQRDTWSEWLLTFQWMQFITLTFKNETYPDVARQKFMSLVRVLNANLYGKHYTKKVGHSYFSYAVVSENQIRDVIHFHVLVDRPINYDLLHRHWNREAGFAQIQQIREFGPAVKYLTKYVAKGGEIEPFRAKETYTPAQLPFWWNESRLFEIQSLTETIDL